MYDVDTWLILRSWLWMVGWQRVTTREWLPRVGGDRTSVVRCWYLTNLAVLAMDGRLAAPSPRQNGCLGLRETERWGVAWGMPVPHRHHGLLTHPSNWQVTREWVKILVHVPVLFRVRYVWHPSVKTVHVPIPIRSDTRYPYPNCHSYACQHNL
jgi:hypothetical protein